MGSPHDHEHSPAAGPPRRVPRGWVAAAMLALIAAFYLLREHWGHALGALPYLLLLACPLLHLFGHGRHRH